jgi:hypothetical protein
MNFHHYFDIVRYLKSSMGEVATSSMTVIFVTDYGLWIWLGGFLNNSMSLIWELAGNAKPSRRQTSKSNKCFKAWCRQIKLFLPEHLS